ncbi:GNAT family N-acetyltransferase [Brevibacterium sp. VCM10]|uniref:GNAT family N-acetyltransferase n=1 Tax=Brevibacterium sp. VCM10 TaxID=1381751 RepID=UPI00047214A4|nr:GNAT family N-acetyltransferase [Brevibacterium sp. VCM10]
MTEILSLRPLLPTDEAELRTFHEQLRADDFEFLQAEGTWADIIATHEREAKGIELPPGRVRAEFLVAEVDGRPVGRTPIRYELNDFLFTSGGHVGYAVAPELRRRGYARQILSLSIERLRSAGVESVLVTCDETNTASASVIEQCGGVLEDVRVDGDGPPKRRYWIGADSGFPQSASTANTSAVVTADP